VAPPHLLIRSIACVEGAVDVAVCYAPRPEYGLLRPMLSHVDGLFEKSRRGDRTYGPSNWEGTFAVWSRPCPPSPA
jgi:hypothetical protein